MDMTGPEPSQGSGFSTLPEPEPEVQTRTSKVHTVRDDVYLMGQSNQ
jgi:hypothetical protein